MNRTTHLVASLVLAALAMPLVAHAEEKVFRIGMIGLDTSHVIAFPQYLNDPKNNTGCKVIAGFPGGSPDLPSSWDRVKKYTEEVNKKYGIEIVDSIEALCQKVDGILLESVDGRPHLAQAKPVIAAKKPFFIDKPMAGNLTDVIEIFRLAKEAGVPCWSSSSLRFGPDITGIKNNPKVGKISGCGIYSPCSLDEHHPDLYWYGVHGVEMLFTLMGPGVETVSRVHTEGTDVVVGVWKGGRIGTYRGLREKYEYGGTVYGDKGILSWQEHHDYGPMLKEVANFFKTGKPPVPEEETVEMFAFMSAADESKVKGGCPVTIASVIENAKAKK
jgi:predicted dehydrogenase